MQGQTHRRSKAKKQHYWMLDSDLSEGVQYSWAWSKILCVCMVLKRMLWYKNKKTPHHHWVFAICNTVASTGTGEGTATDWSDLFGTQYWRSISLGRQTNKKKSWIAWELAQRSRQKGNDRPACREQMPLLCCWQSGTAASTCCQKGSHRCSGTCRRRPVEVEDTSPAHMTPPAIVRLLCTAS